MAATSTTGAAPAAEAAAAAARAARVRAGARVVLSAPELAPFLSPYLAGGYKQDTVEIRELAITWPSACARLDVTAFSMPANGRYHFTALHALVSVCQVGIVVATVAHGFTAKPGELYLRDFGIECRREINRTRDLVLRCELRRAQDVPGAVLYKIAYDWCEGAFSGTLRCFFPRLPAPAGGVAGGA
jgi:hypothetical protein